MEIRCPKCLSAYDVPDERVVEPTMKAVCKNCGEKILVQRVAEKANPTPSETSPPEYPDYTSVMDLSPSYPKHRDKLILGGFLVGLVILLFGGYWLVRGAGPFVTGFPEKPLSALTALVMGKDVYEPCETFLSRNRDAFPQVGRILKVSPLKVETRSVNRQKTATVVMKVGGTKATKNFVFRLQKQQRDWRITSVFVQLGGERYERVFPLPESKV